MLKKTYKYLKYNADKLAMCVSKLMPPSRNLVNQLKSSGIEIKYFCDSDYLAFAEFDFTNDQPIIAVNALKSKSDRMRLIVEELGALTAFQGWLPLDSKLTPNPKYPVLDTIHVHPHVKLRYRNSYEKRVLVLREFTRAFLAPDYIQSADRITLPRSVNASAVKNYLSQY